MMMMILTRSSLPLSDGLMWRVDTAIFLFLLTFNIVAQDAASSHRRRLDLNEPVSRNLVYSSTIQRRWFLAPPLSSVSVTFVIAYHITNVSSTTSKDDDDIDIII